jgi:hypothetical protein
MFNCSEAQARPTCVVSNCRKKHWGRTSTQYNYSTTTLYTTATPIRATGGGDCRWSITKGQYQKGVVLFILFVVVHILHREELSDECAAGTTAPKG